MSTFTRFKNWHTGTGIIKYDPFRAGMKKRTNWWAVVNVDREITRYYRWWVKKRYWIDLHQPAWNAHISIIRGEKPTPQLMHLWKKYHNQQVEFKYSHNVRQSGDIQIPGQNISEHFWFVDVECPFLKQIRTELERPVNWKFHLTIGRTY